jgi:hypothetical protein
VRSHDLIRLLDEPGPERGAPPCKYLFWIDPIGMNSGGARGGNFAPLPDARRRSPKYSPFSRSGRRFPGGRITQLAETELPNKAKQH